MYTCTSERTGEKKMGGGVREKTRTKLVRVTRTTTKCTNKLQRQFIKKKPGIGDCTPGWDRSIEIKYFTH